MKNIMNTVGGGVGVIIMVILAIGELFSLPLGLYYAIINGSLFHGLMSVFIPWWGVIYAITNWVK